MILINGDDGYTTHWGKQYLNLVMLVKGTMKFIWNPYPREFILSGQFVGTKRNQQGC